MPYSPVNKARALIGKLTSLTLSGIHVDKSINQAGRVPGNCIGGFMPRFLADVEQARTAVDWKGCDLSRASIWGNAESAPEKATLVALFREAGPYCNGRVGHANPEQPALAVQFSWSQNVCGSMQ
jgi:hypothetical protein